MKNFLKISLLINIGFFSNFLLSMNESFQTSKSENIEQFFDNEKNKLHKKILVTELNYSDIEKIKFECPQGKVEDEKLYLYLDEKETFSLTSFRDLIQTKPIFILLIISIKENDKISYYFYDGSQFSIYVNSVDSFKNLLTNKIIKPEEITQNKMQFHNNINISLFFFNPIKKEFEYLGLVNELWDKSEINSSKRSFIITLLTTDESSKSAYKMLMLGLCYEFEASNKERDIDLAYYFYNLAAERQLPGAYYCLYCYFIKKGNSNDALKYLNKALEPKNLESLFNFAKIIYSRSNGMFSFNDASNTRVKNLLYHLASKGHEKAKNFLQILNNGN